MTAVMMRKKSILTLQKLICLLKVFISILQIAWKKLKEKRAAKEQQEVKTKSVVQNEEGKVDAEKVTETEKVIEVVKTIEVEKIVEVIKPCSKGLEPCKECAAKDEIIADYEKKKEQLLFHLNYVKESYDVLNRTVTGLQKTNCEREDALTMMIVVMMSKQKAINFYIEVWKLSKKTSQRRKIVVEVQKKNRRNHSGSNQTRSFLLRRKGMELECFIQEKLEPISNAMKLDTLHGIVRKMSRQNRKFLRN
ncbi:hypothetical protein Hdeb2414_s0004g00146131 [Helianthus debilis subsp. tardiflorus]